MEPPSLLARDVARDPPLTTGQKKDQQKADNENTAAGKKKKVTAAQLRVQRGMSTWL